MLILRDPSATRNITDPDIRRLVEQRFIDISAGDIYDATVHGYMIVVESGDSVADIEVVSGCRIQLDGTCAQLFEFIDEHSACYEMVFVQEDSGFGVVIFVPKQQGLDRDLIAICSRYAKPSILYG